MRGGGLADAEAMEKCTTDELIHGRGVHAQRVRLNGVYIGMQHQMKKKNERGMARAARLASGETGGRYNLARPVRLPPSHRWRGM